ncbi:MAG: regulatory protein RecX [Gemmatimonadaceae bacterium]
MSSPSALFPSGPATVQELRESPRTPGRYLVVLSTGGRCVVGVEALAECGATRIGAAVDAAQVEMLRRAGAISALVDRILNMLARSRRTRRELELRLRRLEPDMALITVALDRVAALGLVADEEVARAEASARLRRGEAPGRVRQVLRRKGIGARGAEQAIAEAVADDAFDELATCRTQAEKRWRSLERLEPAVAQRRLVAFLQRRGFASGVIRTVLGELRRR